MATSNGQQLHNDMETLRHDLTQLRGDIASMMGNLTKAGKSEALELRDKAKDVGKRAADATESQIKERPFLAVLVVFLVGLVLGKLIDARRG